MSITDHIAIVALVGEEADIDTSTLFKPASGIGSPIDNFVAHGNAINRIMARAGDEPSPELSSLVVLGYLSAVETYFRTLLSRLVHIDPVTEQMLGDRQVTFATARARPRESLAESLYEDSFASVKELKSKLTEIGFKIPPVIENTFPLYDKICHLRHCCVHRFGYLGSKNAFDLGVRDHNPLIGHLFSAAPDDLEKIADVLRRFLTQCNNHLYRFVVDRTIDSQNKDDSPFDWRWTWRFEDDVVRFRPYYDLFTLHNTQPASANIEAAYRGFHESNLKKIEGMQRRQSGRGNRPNGDQPPA